jgi:hypothetical protein
MRRIVLSVLVAGAIVASPALPALGDVSTTQHLPSGHGQRSR